MPVVAAAPLQTEYQRSFASILKENSANKRARVKTENITKSAGVPSEIAAKFSAPSLQSKKHFVQPVRVGEDDYILLGQQEKFSKNVKYRSKSFDKNLVSRQTPAQVNGDGDSTLPSTPLTPRPAPAVKFDPGQPALSKQAAGDQSAKAVQMSPNKLESKTTNKKKTVPRASRAVGTDDSKPSNLQTDRKQISTEKNSKKENVIPKIKLSATEAKHSEKSKLSINDSTQTDIDRGVMNSNYDTPNYALAYQNKVAPRRLVGTHRLSEYERQYVWRNQKVNTPLLAAEELVHKSFLGEALKGDLSKATEYNRQYRPWSLLKSDPELSKSLKKRQRSASFEEKKEDVQDMAEKRSVNETSNPLKPFFPHGKERTRRSEYESNFRPPWKFGVDNHGAWTGASPPQLLPQTDQGFDLSDHAHRPVHVPIGLPLSRSLQNPLQTPSSESWYKEVLELRERAAEYKKRALGTHFSREHLAQLYAPLESKLWDGEPTARDLPLPRKVDEEVQVDDSELGEVPGSAHSLMTSDTGVQANEDIIRKSYQPNRLAAERQSRKEAWVEDDSVTVPSLEGLSESSYQPPNKNQQQEVTRNTRKRADIKHRPNDDDCMASTSTPVDVSRTSPAVLKAQTTHPTYGVPTKDTHALVDEDGASDKSLKMQFVRPSQSSPAKKSNQLSVIREASGDTFNLGPRAPFPSPPQNTKYEVTRDDIPPHGKPRSLSTVSVASSCSLASDVLERAKKRRDEFWSAH